MVVGFTIMNDDNLIINRSSWGALEESYRLSSTTTMAMATTTTNDVKVELQVGAACQQAQEVI